MAAILAVVFAATPIILFAQSIQLPAPTPQPPPPPAGKVSATLKANLDRHGNASSDAESRKKAYALLLEGQRHMWTGTRTRNRTRSFASRRSAQSSFIAAAQADPRLAEVYTALAELEISLNSQESAVDEAIALGELAVRVDPNNFGSRRLLGRFYSYRSRIGHGSFDRALGEKAVENWEKVAELDPRNAEAWAFLSAFYGRFGKEEKRIEALRSWLSSAAPLDSQFYSAVMGSSETLSPVSASLKLGAALMNAGRNAEAIGVISPIVVDNPDNATAAELLKDAVNSADAATAAAAVEALQAAVYANPDNVGLMVILAEVYERTGRTEDVNSLFTSTVERLKASNTVAASEVHAAYGDMLYRQEKYSEAANTYRESVAMRLGDGEGLEAEEGREFIIDVMSRLIRAERAAGNDAGVEKAIEESRKLFGKDDLFADRQLISYYRDTGKRDRALTVVRELRKRTPDDAGFLRLEATLLTETGKVDEGVKLITDMMKTPPAANPQRSMLLDDEFSNYLFISSLYSQAGRGKDAADAANKALSVAKSAERQQIAKLTLATAQNADGDFAGAESTLRSILNASPNNPIALNNLGYFLIERNERLNEAKEMIERALRSDPTNPSYLDSLGWAYYKLGSYTEAEKFLREAAKHDPSSATIQDHLGDVLKKQGKEDAARTAWERAVLLASDQADVNRIREKLKNK
ncbi:MAG: tetratricopeptide repeat protein [Acidobacteria bacterium]|nr:tetratricopeptide repeat protein [Acidobacteriota bacterium]